MKVEGLILRTKQHFSYKYKSKKFPNGGNSQKERGQFGELKKKGNRKSISSPSRRRPPSLDLMGFFSSPISCSRSTPPPPSFCSIFFSSLSQQHRCLHLNQSSLSSLPFSVVPLLSTAASPPQHSLDNRCTSISHSGQAPLHQSLATDTRPRPSLCTP